MYVRFKGGCMEVFLLIIIGVLVFAHYLLLRKVHRGFSYRSTAIAKLATAIVVKEKTYAK